METFHDKTGRTRFQKNAMRLLYNQNVSCYYIPVLFVRQSGFTQIERIHPQSSLPHLATTKARIRCRNILWKPLRPKKFEKIEIYMETVRKKGFPFAKQTGTILQNGDCSQRFL